MKYQVIVGNIGTVLDTDNGYKANIEFGAWRRASKSPHHSASGEPVTLMKDGEPLYEHPGTVPA